MEAGMNPEMKESNIDDKKLIRTFNEKTQKFVNYETRIGIIDEVIIDQKLLREKPAWNINFVVDFHQIYDVAFPPLLNIKIEKEEKKVTITTSLRKGERERSKIFSDRLRKAIPFFGTQRVEPPILIPPYEKELRNKIKSEFERILRQQLHYYFTDIISELHRLSRDFPATVEKLEEPERFSKTAKRVELDEVEKFSRLTIQGFYILSFLKAVATTSKILQSILEDTDHQHLRKLPEEHKKLIENLNIKPWVDVLDIYRKKRPYSNVIDACAISLILRLNEVANKEKRKEAYFLLSDAEILWDILDKFPKYSQVNDRIRPPVSPMIQHSLFPDFCRSEGLHLLRTSQHFEEFVKAFDKDSIDTQIINLEKRKEQLLKDIRTITPQIRKISEKCDEESKECPCKFRKDCETLIKNIDDFFKREEEITNLRNIISKENVFKPLLEFMETYLEVDISEANSPEIKHFEKIYSQFFSKVYDPDLKEKLDTALRSYEKEYLKNILSIAELSSCFAETYIQAIRNQLSRMHGIVYNIAFSDNKRIKSFIGEIFEEITSEKTQKTNGVKNWFREIFKIITEREDDVEATLLTIILLYSHELYDDSLWIAEKWLDQKSEMVEQFHKEVEFRYMVASSKARKLYSSRNPITAKEGLDRIVEDLVILEKKYPQDIRIPYLIGKILAREYLFTKEGGDTVLCESIEYSRKAIRILDSLDLESKEGFEVLRIPLKNNILYCITKLKNPNKELLKEAEILYNEILKCRDRSHYIETCASFNYFKAQRLYGEDREKSAELYRKALRELLEAIGYGRYQNINSQEFFLLNLQLDEWVHEYEKKYNMKIENTIGEWGAEIESRFL